MTPSPDSDEIKTGLEARAAAVDDWLARCLDGDYIPDGLREAMLYSLLARGKRIRPVLCLLCAELCGLDKGAALPFACALECIHTYSLIHDDLPALDNDDLRRGRPSNHKRFDEPTAILAGDALLTDAFGFMASLAAKTTATGAQHQDYSVPAERVLRAIALVAKAAGSKGMVGGQFLDILHTARPDISMDELAAMHALKTGAMIRAACETGAILSGAQGEMLDAFSAYGKSIGLAFQITDDILDETGDEASLGKPVGSDAARQKSTYPSLLGLDRSRELAFTEAGRAAAALDVFDGSSADFLRGLASYIVNRLS